ncbi:hypothetical protein [Anaerocolumna sp. MB42-C2]|nr:hypothetical protein [Anaerocolumna sp. MB42-C2]WMJ88009.1 hypothetical protein RBU59_00460 [Anaerocolumna sp. MB42-C2]
MEQETVKIEQDHMLSIIALDINESEISLSIKNAYGTVFLI